ncbi:hypothetical protein D3C81_2183720 [compost metagenome]
MSGYITAPGIDANRNFVAVFGEHSLCEGMIVNGGCTDNDPADAETQQLLHIGKRT